MEITKDHHLCIAQSYSLLVLRIENLIIVELFKTLSLDWIPPGPVQTSRLHSLDSVEFPGQLWEPPTSGLLQALALISAPLPQEAVHWDHALHSCHSDAIVSAKKYVSMKYTVVGIYATWTVRQYAIDSFRGLPQTSCTATKCWVAARSSSHFGAEIASCRTLGPLTPFLPAAVYSWEIWNEVENQRLGKLWVLPSQVFNVHSLDSVAFPEHVSLPPKRGLLHCRARNSVPRPQDDVHWVQEPHSSHSAGSSVIWDFSR